jgi:hypothetical protein
LEETIWQGCPRNVHYSSRIMYHLDKSYAGAGGGGIDLSSLVVQALAHPRITVDG